jgi:hypothetical protein
LHRHAGNSLLNFSDHFARDCSLNMSILWPHNSNVPNVPGFVKTAVLQDVQALGWQVHEFCKFDSSVVELIPGGIGCS